MSSAEDCTSQTHGVTLDLEYCASCVTVLLKEGIKKFS